MKAKESNNEFKAIRISKEIYDYLDTLGKTHDTFNSVLTRIFVENGLIGIVTEGEETK